MKTFIIIITVIAIATVTTFIICNYRKNNTSGNIVANQNVDALQKQIIRLEDEELTFVINLTQGDTLYEGARSWLVCEESRLTGNIHELENELDTYQPDKINTGTDNESPYMLQKQLIAIRHRQIADIMSAFTGNVSHEEREELVNQANDENDRAHAVQKALHYY